MEPGLILQLLSRILQENWLAPIERTTLTFLRKAAEDGNYWDWIERHRALSPDFEVILYNISVNGRLHGLVPILDAIRVQHAQPAPV